MAATFAAQGKAMGEQGIWVLGGARTDFARNVAREGLGIDDLVAEVVHAAIDEAGIAPTDLGSVHVANAFGQLFTGQGHLGAMPATVDESLWGLPATRHEAACASGSVAVLAAMAELEAGRVDASLVVGVEVERNVAGDVAAQHLGAASWVGHEGAPRFVWPDAFDRIAQEYDHRYGLDDAHLRAFAELAFRNARTDPRVRQALVSQHAITRAISRDAHKGIALLAPESRPCVTAAFTLYSEILDRIEEMDFAVFSERASVGMGRRLQVFTGGLVRARRARRAAAA